MSWNWSTDWTTQAGVDFTDLTNGPFPMFVRAFGERLSVMMAIAGNTPPAGWYALQISASPITEAYLNWASLQQKLDILATYFVRPGSFSGQSLIKNLKYSDAANTIQDRAFPYPNGWSRAFPRTIYTLSQPGSNGQRARFEAFTGQMYCGVLHTDPLFQTAVTTPTAEQIHSGKYFDYSSGSWTLSNDQVSPPDVVTETGVSVQRGDYITGQFVNDLRDAINQMTITIAGSDWLEYDFGQPYNGKWDFTNLTYVTPNPGSRPLPQAGDADNASCLWGDGTGTSIATADAAWTVKSPLTPVDSEAFCFIQIPPSGGYSSPTYEVRAYSNDFNAGGIPTPLSYQAEWYMLGGNNSGWPQITSGPNTTYTFDAQGSTVQNQLWQSFGTSAVTSGANTTGPVIPFTLTSPPPNWPTTPAAGWTAYKGWETLACAALLNWAVTGGFTYVSGYAGT